MLQNFKSAKRIKDENCWARFFFCFHSTTSTEMIARFSEISFLPLWHSLAERGEKLALNLWKLAAWSALKKWTSRKAIIIVPSWNKWICIFLLLEPRFLPCALSYQFLPVETWIRRRKGGRNVRHRRNAEIIIYCGFIKFFSLLLNSPAAHHPIHPPRHDECNLNTSAIKKYE